MRELHVNEIRAAVKELFLSACVSIPEDVFRALRDAQSKEKSPIGQAALAQIIENDEIAARERIPMCQDTGMAVVCAEIGQDVHLVGGTLESAVNAGVKRGYEEGYLRKSVVYDPIRRVNTGDNTPAILHTEITGGDRVTITVMPKGGGSENMGAFHTLVPAEGAEGVRNFVLKTVRDDGGKSCPPVIVGVGVGGTMDKCAWIAKKALLRPIGSRSPNPFYAAMEEDLLEKINNLGIGPLGMGGRITALDVHIEYYPCHITALPVAVNLQCHSSRHASAEI